MDPFQQKAHFLRRATSGGTLDEINSNASPQSLLGQWLGTLPPSTVPQLPGIGSGTNTAQLLEEVRQQLLDWLIDQQVTAVNPLHERIVNFWRDHFVVSRRKTSNPYMLADYERRLRSNAFADFQELLWQVTTSPAMLHYLDGRQNLKGNINENFSREVMELFTIGRGNYTETDVQEGARALTGWTIQSNPQAGTVSSTFRANQHDDGQKTFLGRTGNLKTEDVVEILANHPSTGRNIGARLWSTFVYPNPETAIVDRLAAVYTSSNRSLTRMIEAVFTSPEFYSNQAYRSQIRSPQEFMIGTIRQLQLSANARRASNALRSMGQSLYSPQSVRGWPADDGWLTAPSLLTRINIAREITLTNGDVGGFQFNPQRFTKEDLVKLLLDNDLDPAVKSAKPTLSIPEFAALIISTALYQLA